MPESDNQGSSGAIALRRRRGRRGRRLWRTRIAMAAVGVVLVAGAGVVRFVVLPSVAKLPANTNTTNVYTGTAPVLLNAAAVTPGSTAPLLWHNLPLTINETVKVLKSSSSAAVVDYRTTEVAGGHALATMDDRYVVDRSTLEATTGLTWSGLTAATGLTINFPIGTLQQGYTGWVQDTGRTTPLHFSGTATKVVLAGKTYDFGFQADVFTQSTAAEPITDPQELAALPASVPKSEVPALVAQMKLPSSELATLTAEFAKFPNTIPLAYTYAATDTYWVSPSDGVVVDLQAVETRTVELPASLTGVAVPLATVSQFVYTDSPATLVARINEARTDASDLTLAGTTLPLVGLVVGVVLLVGAVVLGVRRPRPPEATKVVLAEPESRAGPRAA
jgi:hypothetical protein